METFKRVLKHFIGPFYHIPWLAKTDALVIINPTVQACEKNI